MRNGGLFAVMSDANRYRRPYKASLWERRQPALVQPDSSVRPIRGIAVLVARVPERAFVRISIIANASTQ